MAMAMLLAWGSKMPGRFALGWAVGRPRREVVGLHETDRARGGEGRGEKRG